MHTDSPIVVGLARHQPSVLRFGAAQATMTRRRLQVVHAAGLTAKTADFCPGVDVPDSMAAAGQFILDEAKQLIKVEFGDAEAEFVLSGDGPIQALGFAADRARLLVLGSDEHPWRDRLFQTRTAGHFAMLAACPVVVVPELDVTSSGDVVAAIDGDTPARGVLQFAFEQASLRRARLNIIHAVTRHVWLSDLADLGANMSEVLAGWREKFPDVEVIQTFGLGTPGKVITEMTSRAGLVVIGRPHSTLRPLHVSRPVAIEVLQRANCAVAVVPSFYRGA